MNELQTALCEKFEAMEREKQMDALQQEGIYIGKLKLGSGTMLLYQYQSIYVEVTYSVHRMHIDAVHCFTDTAVLDNYFSSTDFDTLEPD